MKRLSDCWNEENSGLSPRKLQNDMMIHIRKQSNLASQSSKSVITRRIKIIKKIRLFGVSHTVPGFNPQWARNFKLLYGREIRRNGGSEPQALASAPNIPGLNPRSLCSALISLHILNFCPLNIFHDYIIKISSYVWCRNCINMLITIIIQVTFNMGGECSLS